MNAIPIFVPWLVAFVILGPSLVFLLVVTVDYFRRGGRKWCDACGRKTCRIRPLEHLAKGKLFPRCPRCGGRVRPHPPILTSKRAARLLRKESYWDVWTIRLLRRVAKTEQTSTPPEAKSKTPKEPSEANTTNRKCKRVRESLQKKLPQSHTHTPTPPPHSLDQSDTRDQTGDGLASSSFFRENVEAWRPETGARPRLEGTDSNQERQPTRNVFRVAIADLLCQLRIQRSSPGQSIEGGSSHRSRKRLHRQSATESIQAVP